MRLRLADRSFSRIAAAVIFGAAVWGWGGEAAAQSLNFGARDSDEPIEIYAENGIEWQQENLIFLARGNARAVRGDVTVYADELKAYYRERADGGTDIWRLDAEGRVRIKTPTETAFGEKAVYQVDKGILVISGGKVRLVTATDEITADKQIEYWEKKQMAVAVGLVIFGPSPWGDALAQKLNFGSGDSDQPIEIFADNGIEWQQE
ncbi:MAG: hypothetical protein O7A64_00310, partial [Alphaproteobacteria bacterium]|nr:hypothetical protein [Alphaproteobacteria bacterium]